MLSRMGFRVDFSKRFLQVTVLAVVLVAGLAGGFLVSRSGLGDPEPGEAAAASAEPEREPEPEPVATPTGTPVEPDVSEAVARMVGEFLTAEAEGDYAASFALLSAADQDELGPAAEWESSHADLPPVEGHELLTVRELDGRVEAVTDVALDSTLDPFVGLVPARGRATWTVVSEGGEWRVSYTDSVLEPRYPGDEGVEEVALAWAQARQDCQESPVVQHSSVEGLPALAGDLCGSEERVGVGEAGDLEEGPDAEPFVAAWGPSVFSWSRVVPVTGPVPLKVLLAPIDDEWRVVGILRP